MFYNIKIIKMKTLIKKITIIAYMLLICVLGNTQVKPNDMVYIEQRWNGASGYYLDTLYFNIDSIIDAPRQYLDVRLGDTIRNWWPTPNIYDLSHDARIMAYELSAQIGTSNIKDIYVGDFSGKDTMLVAFVNLVIADFNTHKKYKYELALRFEKYKNGLTPGDTSFAKLYYSPLEEPKFVYGIYHSSNDSTAFLQKLNNLGEAYIVDVNTAALRTDKLAEYFQTANQ